MSKEGSVTDESLLLWAKTLAEKKNPYSTCPRPRKNKKNRNLANEVFGGRSRKNTNEGDPTVSVDASTFWFPVTYSSSIKKDVESCWYKVMGFLEVQDWINLSKANSYFYTLVSKGCSLWKKQYQSFTLREGTSSAIDVIGSSIASIARGKKSRKHGTMEKRSRPRRSLSCPDMQQQFAQDNCFIRVAEKGTLDEIIINLTSTDPAPDPEDVKTFLMTYRSVVKTEAVIQSLEKRYEGYGARVNKSEIGYYGMKRSEYKRVVLRPIQVQVCSFMQKMIMHSSEFFDDKSVRILQFFIRGFVAKDNLDMAKSLLLAINACITQNKRHSAHIKELDPPQLQRLTKSTKQQSAPTIFPPSSPQKKEKEFLAFDTKEFAQKLTKVEFAIFASIKPAEFLMREDFENEQVASPNIQKMIDRFNQVSRWVTTMILTPQHSDKTRVKMIMKFIKVAKELRKLHNYHTLYSVLSGLNEPSILRLQETFKKVPQKYIKVFEELTILMDPSGAHANYRSEMTTVKPPVIPFIGVCLRDVTYLLSQQELAKGDTLINFKHQQSISKILEKIEEYQKVPFIFPKVSKPTVASPAKTGVSCQIPGLTATRLFDDKSLKFISEMIEPPTLKENRIVQEKKGLRLSIGPSEDGNMRVRSVSLSRTKSTPKIVHISKQTDNTIKTLKKNDKTSSNKENNKPNMKIPKSRRTFLM